MESIRRNSGMMLVLMGMISLVEAAGLCLLSCRQIVTENREFFAIIGKIAYQDFEGYFAPDFVFRTEAEGAFDALSTSEKVKVMVWAGLRYKDSSSVMSAIYEIAKKHKLIQALDYQLMMLQDNAINDTEMEELKTLRAALKSNSNP